MLQTRKLVMAAVLAMGFAPSAGVQAQEYPTGPVTMILPFSPGTGTDVIGRYLAEQLAELWGQPVVAENRTGAGGSIGASLVARSAPDGQTLLFMSASYSANPAVQRDMTFDPVKDLTLVAIGGTTSNVLTVRSDLPVESVADLTEYGKDNTVFWGHSGIGGVTWFSTLRVLEAAGVANHTEIPYQGMSDVVLDVVGGRVDICICTLGVIDPHLESGAVRALAIVGPERLEALPDVPTVAEAGLVDAAYPVWIGLLAPSATPREILLKINQDVNSIMSSEAGTAFLATQAFKPLSRTLDEAAAMVPSEIEMWKELAKRVNAVPSQ